MALFRSLCRESKTVHHIFNNVRNYAVTKPSVKVTQKAGKGAVTKENVELPLETDTKILATYVCGTNLLVENGENVKLKPDSEYPDWLWKLHTGEPLKLSDLDPNTLEYWKKVRKMERDTRKYINSLQRCKRDYK